MKALSLMSTKNEGVKFNAALSLMDTKMDTKNEGFKFNGYEK